LRKEDIEDIKQRYDTIMLLLSGNERDAELRALADSMQSIFNPIYEQDQDIIDLYNMIMDSRG